MFISAVKLSANTCRNTTIFSRKLPDRFLKLSLAISRPNADIGKLFQQRLQRTFAKYGFDSGDFCAIPPKMDEKAYWNLQLLSDVFLDSFGWSGGHTTLKAIACNLPIVTCPGEFMRGRHSCGILEMLGVTETVAQTAAE